MHEHTHIHLMSLFPGLPRSASTRKVGPIWTLLKQEIKFPYRLFIFVEHYNYITLEHYNYIRKHNFS